MAVKKLNSMPDYTARIPKTPHDVSQSTGFTSVPGILNPVYFDMLHLGDELHFSASMFTRLNPLWTQALGDIEIHLDYFFVPLSVMYTPASSMFYQTDDLVSSVINTSDLNSTDFPVWNMTVDNPAYGQTSWLSYFRSSKTYPTIVSDSPAQQHSFLSIGQSVFRMFDFLDMKPNVLLPYPSDLSTDYPEFTPWYALAYQAIYQLHPQYRNFDREKKSYIYNIDKWFSTGIITDNVIYQQNVKCDWSDSIFVLRSVDRHHDYFNSVKVSPMGSAVSMLKDPGDVFNSVNAWLNDGTFTLLNPSSPSSDFDEATQVNSSSGLVASNNIRQLFMVDKLLRVIGRAEKNYESQFLAHYGIKIPHDVLHNITHIGHDMSVLRPNSVISTANTFNGETGSALGEIGGQGSNMLTGEKHNFKAPFHGVFMCLAYFKPRQRYLAGFNKLHQMNTILDFWQPEFDKKGMQPLFEYEANPLGVFSTGRLGWQFAYEQFKRKYDRISVAFAPQTRTNDRTSVNTYSQWFVSTMPFRHLYETGEFVGVANPTTDDYFSFKVGTTELNGVMQVGFDPRWSDSFDTAPWLIFQRDPFICDFNMHCKKVNGMSEFGEPEL